MREQSDCCFSLFSIIRWIWHPSFPSRFDIKPYLVYDFLQVLPYVFAPKAEYRITACD